MSEIYDGGPAHPTPWSREEDGYVNPGMSLRDWFAGQALAGILARGVSSSTSDQKIAEAAYAIADTMLGARAAKKEAE